MQTKHSTRTIQKTTIILDEDERFQLHKTWGSQSFLVEVITVQVEVDDSDLDDPPKPTVHISARGNRLLKGGRTNDQILSEGFYPTMYRGQELPADLLTALELAQADLPEGISSTWTANL